VQVMEFADLGVAGREHLDIELGSDRLEFVGPDRGGEAVHGFAPAPEIVVAFLLRAARDGRFLIFPIRGDRTGMSTALGQPGHRTLEGVRVQVRHAGEDPRPDRLGHTTGIIEQVAGGAHPECRIGFPAIDAPQPAGLVAVTVAGLTHDAGSDADIGAVYPPARAFTLAQVRLCIMFAWPEKPPKTPRA